MDALTHTLTAAALGLAGGRRWGRRAPLWLAFSANLQKMELLARFGGPAAWLEASYGACHSVFTTPLLGLLAVVALRRRLGGWKSAGEIVAVGLASHLALDLVTAPGVRLLWPLSSEFYGCSLLARYDLLTIAVLSLALVGPLLLNLVNRDIGAASYNPQPAARAGLAIVLLLLAARGAIKLQLDRRLGADGELTPSVIQPMSWYLVRDQGTAYTVEEVTLTSNGSPRQYRKPEPNRVFETAADTPLGRAFLADARFPHYTLESGRKAMLVRIRDLRFYTPAGQAKDYSVEIEVTAALQVVSQRVRW